MNTASEKFERMKVGAMDKIGENNLENNRMFEHLKTGVQKMQEGVKTDVGAVKDEIDKEVAGENRHKFGQFTIDIHTMKEEMMREVEGTDNDTNNIMPSVVVASGWNPKSRSLRSAEMFDWSKRTWSPLQPMKECRQAATSFVYEGEFTVTGGWTDAGYTDTMERMDINPNMRSAQWFDFPAKLPSKLYAHSSVIYDERLITIGGYDGCTYSDSIHEVHLVQPYTRNLLSTMPQPRCFQGAQLFDDKILIVGGRKTGSFKDSMAGVLMYDINRKECKQMAPLPFAVCEMATVRWGDNVIVIGGADKDGKATNTVVIYNVHSGICHMLPGMKCKRRECTAVVSRGAIVVMGGVDERDKVLSSVEFFNLDRYRWEELPQMSEARAWATAAAVCKCGNCCQNGMLRYEVFSI